MPTRSDDDTNSRRHSVDNEHGARYAHLRLGRGDVVIYDRTNEDAWLQTDSAIGLELMR
jgi:hypothetical protein